MFKSLYLILVLNLTGIVVCAQTPADTSLKKTDDIFADTSIDYDALFNEMEAFLDSISSPHSYTLAAFTFGKGFFNYKTKNDIDLQTARKTIFSPVAGYYHKSGMGITG